MTALSDNGGTLIENYQLEIKLEDWHDWQVVLGEDDAYNLNLFYEVPSEMIQAGEMLQARYRVKNQIGWSPYSKHEYLLKAGVPLKPHSPVFISADATSITIEILQSDDANGSPITEY